jgi:outer membrane receptor protein involved in Fe transport
MGGTARSLAAFTHWNIDLTDQFSLIAGARYTNERKTGFMRESYFRDPLFDPLALAGVMPGIGYNLRTTNNALSGTLGVQYKPSDDAMIYFTYNRGFKAGGVNLDVNAAGIPGSVVFGSAGIAQSPIYTPEKINGFELGAKVDWLDGRARTNVAAFYNSLTNLQVAQFLGLQFQIINAPKAKVYGFELEQTVKVSDVVTLNGGLTWLPKATFGNDAALVNLAARRFSTAPKFAANGSVNVEYPVNDNVAITARLQTLYTSQVFTNPVNDLTQKGFALVNANLGLKSLSAGWQIEGFVQNLFNQDYVTSHFNTPLQGDDRNAYLGAPRTYGITLRGSF